jgi:hypothetical protein
MLVFAGYPYRRSNGMLLILWQADLDDVFGRHNFVDDEKTANFGVNPPAGPDLLALDRPLQSVRMPNLIDSARTSGY